MPKKILSKTLSFPPQIIAMLFLDGLAAWAWTEPSQAPPAGNKAGTGKIERAKLPF